jgi:hypothetical protein
MDQFDLKSASLTYLTNPVYQQIIKQQKELKSTSNKSDIKFYRKRITALTKDMLKGEIPENTYIKTIYENYVNALIKYFKMLDTSDIIQQQHNNVEQSVEQNVENHVDNHDTLDAIKEVTIDKMDDLLMRKISGPTTLDNYVIKTQHATEDTRIIPIMLDINLKEPGLKTKGVKEKAKPLKVKAKPDTDIDIEKVIFSGETKPTADTLC